MFHSCSVLSDPARFESSPGSIDVEGLDEIWQCYGWACGKLLQSPKRPRQMGLTTSLAIISSRLCSAKWFWFFVTINDWILRDIFSVFAAIFVCFFLIYFFFGGSRLRFIVYDCGNSNY